MASDTQKIVGRIYFWLVLIIYKGFKVTLQVSLKTAFNKNRSYATRQNIQIELNKI
jgi:hypothetical protein